MDIDIPDSTAVISLVDAAESGATTMVVSSRLPAELPCSEISAERHVFQPKYSRFVPVVLRSLYADPVGVTSTAWRADRLKEMGYSLHDFEQLRSQLFSEKSPPPLWCILSKRTASGALQSPIACSVFATRLKLP